MASPRLREEPRTGAEASSASPLARVPDAWFRAVGAVGFGAYTVFQASRYRLYANKALFAAETLVYVLIALAYVTRRAPTERARGAAETVLPLAGAVLPFALLRAPPVLSGRAEDAVLWVLAVGSTLSVAGYASLRRSFSILVEAREPVTGGVYRFVRHPVYAGQIVAAAGVLAWRFAWANALVFAAFVAIQAARAVLEERKLARVFPAYAEYARRTARFVPFVY
jgi:protein-S-isoprenylcysteine O-methyltransferase Ste14